MRDVEETTSASPTPEQRGRCAQRWRCEVCGLQGQTWLGHEETTDLAAHQRWVHGVRR